MVKKACATCSKKLTLTEQTTPCKCGKVYCSQHRHFEAHSCSFDYKTVEVKALATILNEGKSTFAKVEAI